jgi:hypothetical protein
MLPPGAAELGRRRFTTKHWTINLSHIETREPPWRLRRRQALADKRQRQVENRRQAELAASNRTTTQIRMLTAKLEAEVADLEARIAADLKVAAYKDPSHEAFPVSTRAMLVRRDNLKITIRALAQRGSQVGAKPMTTES